jgi:hypothetical protein
MNPLELMRSHASSAPSVAEFPGVNVREGHALQKAVGTLVAEFHSGNELLDAVEPFLIHKTPATVVSNVGNLERLDGVAKFIGSGTEREVLSAVGQFSESGVREQIRSLGEAIRNNESNLLGFRNDFKGAGRLDYKKKKSSLAAISDTRAQLEKQRSDLQTLQDSLKLFKSK